MPICEVRALHLAVDGLADVVHEGGSDGDVRVESDFAGHDAGQPRDFRRVGEHVLPVARAVLEAAHQAADIGVQIVEAEVERDGFTLLAHRLVGLVLHLLDDLFDARGVDAAVGDQAFDGLLRDLAAVGIEARQDDRAGRVVDDEVDARGHFERADVAALAPDDAALEVVARQIDHRHRRLDGVLGGAALDGLGDVVLGAVDRCFAGFGVEALEQVGGIVARLVFDLLDQQLFGFVGGEAGDALELVLLAGHQLLVFADRGRGRLLPIGDGPIARADLLFEAVEPGLALVERRVALAERLLHGGGLLPLLQRLALGVHHQLVGLLLGVEEGFLLEGVGVALSVPDEAGGLVLGTADGVGGDAFAVCHPPGKHRAGYHHRDGQVDDVSEYRQHA